jgi:protein-disulfide isomerase
VRIVVFGDYQQSGTAEADAAIRGELAGREDLRYEYRHFPFNKECNPAVKLDTKFPHSCRAARAAQAAGSLEGAEGYWKMHVWLLEHQEELSDAALREAAGAMGIDPDALLAEMGDPAIGSAVVEDAKAAKRLGVVSVPTVFIDERRVPRWKLQDENILPQIIAEATGN